MVFIVMTHELNQNLSCNQHKANFNFFGDSWYWTWNLGDRDSMGPLGVTSKELKDLNTNFASDITGTTISWSQGHSLYDVYLKYLGYCPKCFCFPTQNWNQTLESILATKLNGGIIESKDSYNNIINRWDTSIDEGYAVIFYSNIIRGQVWDAPIHNKKDLYDYIDRVNINSLNKIAGWAITNKQKVILIGGQTCFNQSTFDQWKKNNPDAPVILGAADLIATHIKKLVGLDFFSDNNKDEIGYWKLSTDIVVNEDWDIEVLEDMDRHQKFYIELTEHPAIRPLLYPDDGHPSLLGQYFTLDLILSLIADNFN